MVGREEIVIRHSRSWSIEGTAKPEDLKLLEVQDEESSLQFASRGQSIDTIWDPGSSHPQHRRVNVLESDLPPRQELTPWLAQLFVLPDFRRQDVGRDRRPLTYLALLCILAHT
jgi:hypothetical protein